MICAAGTGLAFDLVGIGQHFGDQPLAFLDRPAQAAGILDHQRPQVRADGEVLFGKEGVDVVGFRTLGDYQGGGGIGVADIAADRPAQQVHRLAGPLHAVAHLVDIGHDAVDPGICRQPLLSEPVGDLAGRRGAGVAGDEDTDVIPRRHPPVRAHDALERGALVIRDVIGRSVIAREGVIPLEGIELDVMAVHVGAGRDIDRSEADKRVVLQHGFALANEPGGDLVAGRHVLQRGQAFAGNRGSRRHIHPGDNHIVARVQADEGIEGAGVHRRSPLVQFFRFRPARRWARARTRSRPGRRSRSWSSRPRHAAGSARR